MGSRRDKNRPEWVPDWAMVSGPTRTKSSKKNSALDPIDTSYVNTSRRQQYQPYRAPPNKTAHANNPTTYKPYRGKPTTYLSEVPMPTFTYRVTEDTSATSPQNPRRTSFEFDTLEDSILIGQSYHRMKEKNRKEAEKSLTNEYSRKKSTKRTVSGKRSVDSERWTPSPPSSFRGIQDDDSPVSPMWDRYSSSENGKRLTGSSSVRSPVFRPTPAQFHSLEFEQRRQPRESTRETTVCKNNREKEKQRGEEVKPRTPVYISYIDVNIRGDDQSVTDAFLPDLPKGKKMKKHKGKKKCSVM